MKNLLFCFTLLFLMHTTSHAQSIVGTYDAKTGAVKLTADTDKVRSVFTRLLDDPKASVGDVFIWKSENASHFVLLGRVKNSSRNINLIGWTLKNVDGNLDAKTGFEIACEGNPCSACDMTVNLKGWYLECYCEQNDCNSCRCDMKVKISINLF